MCSFFFSILNIKGICSIAIRTSSNLLTRGIIAAIIIFLVMICELEKDADLRGFQCVITKLSNYCLCMSAPQRGGGRLASMRDDRCSGFVLMASWGMWVTCIKQHLKYAWLKKKKNTLELDFFFLQVAALISLESVLHGKISRLMLLRSLYLWSSVQITAIRLFTCE